MDLKAKSSRSLPRLLYLSDVPVEASYHGSALLYRLLEDYPKERLAIVEAGTIASLPERRITGVEYHDLRLPFERISRSRAWRWYHAVALKSAKARASLLLPRLKKFSPNAVLTVSHGFSWITAAEIARRLEIPLHLVCHDEWSRAGEMQNWKDKLFGELYRSAASRLCVSPFMVEEYERRYGVPGDVLYPSRAIDASGYEGPPQRLLQSDGPHTCVFAGTINSGGVVALLRRLAEALATVGGRLVIYGPISSGAARTSNLFAPNIVFGGMLPSAQLVNVMRDEADALFVPMSFAQADRENVLISFPSKLTDYTAAALPLLICGPEECSAVRWARENAGVAEVVAEETDEAMIAAVKRLAHEPSHRLTLAARAQAVGEAIFSHAAAGRVLTKALMLHLRTDQIKELGLDDISVLPPADAGIT